MQLLVGGINFISLLPVLVARPSGVLIIGAQIPGSQSLGNDPEMPSDPLFPRAGYMGIWRKVGVIV